MGDPYARLQAGARGMDTATTAVGATIVERGSTRVELPDGTFEVVQCMIDLEPGEWIPGSVDDGQALAVVASGAVTALRGNQVDLFTPG